MIRKLRIVTAAFFITGITLLFVLPDGGIHRLLGWMAKVQFLPAILSLNLVVVAALLVLTLVFGRIYCSVICPLGILQDGISFVSSKRKGHRYTYRKEARWLRYGIWAAYVACLFAGVHFAVALLAPYSAYGRMVSSIANPVVPTVIVSAVTLVVIAVFAWVGGRSYCNSICPVGTTLGFFSRFAMFRPVIDSSKCRHCMQCEHKCKGSCISISKESQKIDYSRCVDCFDCLDTCKFGALKYRFAWKKADVPVPPAEQKEDGGRRAFIAGVAVAAGAAALHSADALAKGKKVDGGLAKVLPKSAPEREVPITPPGSASVADFYRKCTACQLCIANCPNKVLRPSLDPERLMQPEMSYDNGFCCPECTTCSELCPTGAVRRITREEKTSYHIGIAKVNTDLCISAAGKNCGKCSRICPSGAIMMVEGVPVVAEQVCTGCGACEQYCPVRPVSAILVNGRYSHEQA